MAITTYPLNNQNYDASGAELFHCTRTSGVWAGDEDFNIGNVSGSDNNIPVLPGLAWIRNATFSGKVVAQKTPVTLNLGLPDPTYPRIDAIVLQFSANKNATELIVKKGSASSSAVPPERIQTESVYELHLYHVLRKPGAVAITKDDITDLRTDEKWCGIMYDDVTPKGSLGFIKSSEKGNAGGVATLGEDGKVPSNQLPPSEKPDLSKYMLKTERGAYNGVASLVSGKVPSSQLPSMNYIPTSQKGMAGGVASLDSNSELFVDQLPKSFDEQKNVYHVITPISAGGLSNVKSTASLIKYGPISFFNFYVVLGLNSGSYGQIRFNIEELYGKYGESCYLNISSLICGSNANSEQGTSYTFNYHDIKITNSNKFQIAVKPYDGNSFSGNYIHLRFSILTFSK